jgi:hypothetical protein
MNRGDHGPCSDDVAALHARVEVLERAARDRLCEICAAELARKRRLPIAGVVFAGLVGVSFLAFLVFFCVAAFDGAHYVDAIHYDPHPHR